MDGVSLALVLIALLLFFVTFAPDSVESLLERMTSLKLPGGIELGLQAASRAEQVQQGVSSSIEDLPDEMDDVTVRQRPLEGNSHQQFEAVRDTLQARLRFVHTVVFGDPQRKEGNYPDILKKIEEERLLRPSEMGLLRDLLGRAEDEVERLPHELLSEFLDASWKFAVRFATLTHERLVRKRLAETGWALMDFEQNRKHRRDFLAYREQTWLLVAARVEPGALEETRRRLEETPPPFEALPVVVLPDKRQLPPDDQFPRVDVMTLGELLGRSASYWTQRPGWD